MLRVAVVLGAGLVLAFAAVSGAIARALTRPPRRTYASAIARGLPGDPGELVPARPFTAWSFAGEPRGRKAGPTLEVWDVPGEDSAGPLVVLTHGWGDSRIGGLVRLPAIASLASRVVLWDLPGHGVSSGVSALGAREARDLLRLLACLPGPVLLYGWSMGAGIAMEAAVLEPARVRGVIAETPYRQARTPAEAVLRARGLPAGVALSAALGLAGLRSGSGAGWVRGVTGRFDRCEVAARLTCPLLVLGAERDAVSPLADVREIAASGRGERIVVPGATHNGLWRDEATGQAAQAAVRGWIRGLVRPAGNGA